jgi:CelD/BcsL family acetyltransferase involved in cellulose biosynthesis
MQNLILQVLTSANDLPALAEEWNDLALRCTGYFLSQTFLWAEAAWETIARPRGRTLNCLVLRFEGRLVAVWPLVICLEHGLRVLRPLGFDVHEYCAPLVEPGEEAERRTALLWEAAARSADLAVLPHVRADSLLAGILDKGRHWSVRHAVDPAPYVARAEYPDWNTYYAMVSSQLRRHIRRRRRQLAEQGEVVLARESAAGCPVLIDWMLDRKKNWIARSHLANDWIDHADYRAFLMTLAAREDATGGVAVFTLRLNGAPIAAALVGVNRSRIEGYVTTYDPEWDFYSPGNILNEHMLQWAFERGLDFDFRNGDQPYKYKWAKRSCPTVTWQIATGKRGIPSVACLSARLLAGRLRRKAALGRFVPSRWRGRLKALLAPRVDSQVPV